jgi:hypothetical protein
MLAAVVWVLMQVNSVGQYPGPYAFFPNRAECERARPSYNDAYKNPKPPIPPSMALSNAKSTQELSKNAPAY